MPSVQPLDILTLLWPYLAAALALALPIVASGHAVLHKRDSRAAVLWVGVIWLAPIVGSILYALLGINRIQRRARSLRAPHYTYSEGALADCSPQSKAEWLTPEVDHLAALGSLVQQVVNQPLVTGNHVEPFANGDEAYPRMLQAIGGARHSITLSTYIFGNDHVGWEFAAALGDAVRRGVEVRVLIDDTGARYSLPTINRTLRRHGVPFARFLPTLLPWRMMVINLRNHRKILVVDGVEGFTGGLNIRAGNVLADAPRHPVQDLHFRLTGPVVGQLQESFSEDWVFCTGELLTGSIWFPEAYTYDGPVTARGISDGPDEDFEKLRWVMLGAIGCAQQSIRVATPYFLPDMALITALNVAAMRGVRVDICLPATNNLPFVAWASQALWPHLLSHGCRIWLTPPPFDHSKLMVVDEYWTLIGSANWDPRSLRLNFEFNVECYGRDFSRDMAKLFDHRTRAGHEVTLEDTRDEPLPIRLRNGIARLFTPYL